MRDFWKIHSNTDPNTVQVVIGYLDSTRERMLALHDFHSLNYTDFPGHSAQNLAPSQEP